MKLTERRVEGGGTVGVRFPCCQVVFLSVENFYIPSHPPQDIQLTYILTRTLFVRRYTTCHARRTIAGPPNNLFLPYFFFIWDLEQPIRAYAQGSFPK